MKTAQRFVFLACSISLFVGCGAFDKRNAEKEKQEVAAKAAAAPSAEIPDEVTLKEDRAALDELRKDIPEDTRRENDEVAFILKNMATMEEEPSRVRDRFNTAVRKRREKMDRQLRKERDDFSKNERASREQFLEKMKDEREDFNAKKRDQKERKKFFDKQDGERKEFFTEQSEKRKDFESNITDRRKTFEDYVREQTNKFNQEHRAYAQSYNERRQALELKRRAELKAKSMKKSDEATNTAGSVEAQAPATGARTQVPQGPTEEDRKLIEELNKPRTEKIKPLKAGDKDQ